MEDSNGERCHAGQRFSLRWLGVIFWAAFLALVAEYFLTGWNAEQGSHRDSGEWEIPPVAFRPVEPVSRNSVISELEEFLIARARPDLLPDVRNLDHGQSRSRIDELIADAVKTFDPRAARLGALLAITEEGGPAYDFAPLLRAAELGDAESQFRIASSVFVSQAEGVEKARARKFLEQSSSVGHLEAKILLATLLFMEGQIEEAHKTIAPAAREGNMDAVYQEGVFFANRSENGSGAEEAAKCFRRGAERGHPEAMFAYGLCFEAGFGLERSATEAMRWMKLAAVSGNPSARSWLGKIQRR